jgi:hypothetical protein
MDSRTLNLAVDDILQLTSAAQRSRSPVNTRRYAHYFSPAPSLTHGYTDADSAWEFMAPSPLTQLSPHTSTSTCNTQYSTAAQQIVARYRAAEAGVEFVERKLVDDVDRQASIDSETASVGDPSVLDDSYTLPSPAVKVRYRQSRCEGQSQAVRILHSTPPCVTDG